MRKIFIMLSAVVASMAAVSCVEENIVEPENQDAGQYIELSASYEDVDTKTHLEEDVQKPGVFNVKWDSNDQISVFDGKAAALFSLKEGSISTDGLSATFSGNMAGTPQYAFYPQVQALKWTTGGDVEVNLPSVQCPKEGSYDSNAALAISKVENDNLTFKNVGAILGVTINNDNIKAVRLISKSAVPMTGQAKVNANTLELVADKAAGNSVEIQGDFVKGSTYYMAVYPGNHTEGFTIAFIDKDGRIAAFDATAPLDVTRNSNVLLANIPTDAVQAKFADGYNLLMDEKNLQVGDEIIITAIDTKGYHAFSKMQGRDYVKSNDVNPTYSGLKLQSIGDADVLTLEAGNLDGFALHGINGYVGPEKSETAISEKTSWTITKNKEGLFEISNGSTSLRYNVQSPRFKGYTGTQNLLDATIFFKKGLPTLDEPVVTATVADNKLTVSWDRLVANAKDYTVTLTGQVDQSVVTPTTVNPESIVYEGLAWMTNYELKVVANPSDPSQYNPSSKVQPVEILQNPNRTALTMPEITSNVVERNSVTVEWNAVANAVSYSIVCVEDAKLNQLNLTSNSVTIKDLPWGATTNFTLVAKPAEGSTEYLPSQTVKFSAAVGEKVISIADLLQSYTPSKNGVSIAGYATSLTAYVAGADDNGSFSNKMAVVDNDGKAGSGVVVYGKDLPKVVRGQKVEISLSGAKLKDFEGLIEITGASVTPVEEFVEINTPTITWDKIGQYQGMLVQIDVTTPGTSENWSSATNLNPSAVNLYVPSNSPVSKLKYKASTTGLIKGIASCHNKAYQLCPLLESDVDAFTDKTPEYSLGASTKSLTSDAATNVELTTVTVNSFITVENFSIVVPTEAQTWLKNVKISGGMLVADVTEENTTGSAREAKVDVTYTGARVPTQSITVTQAAKGTSTTKTYTLTILPTDVPGSYGNSTTTATLTALADDGISTLSVSLSFKDIMNQQNMIQFKSKSGLLKGSIQSGNIISVTPAPSKKNLTISKTATSFTLDNGSGASQLTSITIVIEK